MQAEPTLRTPHAVVFLTGASVCCCDDPPLALDIETAATLEAAGVSVPGCREIVEAAVVRGWASRV